MKQQPQGLVSVSGVVQGSESPSSYVPQNHPEQGLFFWMDVQGLVSDSSRSSYTLARAGLLRCPCNNDAIAVCHSHSLSAWGMADVHVHNWEIRIVGS